MLIMMWFRDDVVLVMWLRAPALAGGRPAQSRTAL
jgi:hypothetical protein